MPHDSRARRRLTCMLAGLATLSLTSACADPTTTAPVVVLSAPASAIVAAAPTAVAIGNIIGYGVNDAGIVVGPSDGNKSGAYLWSPATSLKLLGAGGVAWDVSQDGLAVGGNNAAGVPVLWTSTTVAGARAEVVIPDAGFGGAVRAMVSNESGAPVLMTGNVWVNGSNKTPARWTPCTTESGCLNGWLLTTVPFTPPINGAWGQDINPSGMIVGMEGSGCCRAAFWDADGSQTVLDPIPGGTQASAWGINDAGTVIVGQSSGIAVMWVRESTATPFGAPTRLETTPCKGAGGSIAYAVNPDLVATGTVVGQACGLPVAWKVDVALPGTIQRVVLPSPGRSTSGVARSINRSTSSSHRITGQVNGAGVYWTSF
jgi:uncharacterized membrane protein